MRFIAMTTASQVQRVLGSTSELKYAIYLSIFL
jgi:hypothetical protein